MNRSRPHRRPSPYQTTRVMRLHTSRNRVAIPGAGFPGRTRPFDEERSTHLLGSLGLALLLHAALLAAMLAMPGQSTLDTPAMIQIPVQLIKTPPAPLPAARAERSSEQLAAEVARAPRALAHRPRAVRSVARAVETPTTAPAQQAPARIDVQDLPAETAPRALEEVAREQVTALDVLPSTSVPSETRAMNTSIAEAGSLRATREIAPTDPALSASAPTPMGTDYGSRSAAPVESNPEAVIAGSALAVGIVTDRNIVGFADAPPLPELDTGSSETILLATGGPEAQGDGAIGGDAGCFGQPEVQAYTHLIHDRVYPRLGDRKVTRTTTVSGRITLDPAGSLIDIELLEGDDPALGQSAVAAFQAAAPFPAMSASVRCLADAPIRWNFRLHPAE